MATERVESGFDRFEARARAEEARRSRIEGLKTVLLAESSLHTEFLLLLGASCVIATAGLLSGSVAAIIGAMIVAPLMLPIRGFAFGALQADLILSRKAIESLAAGCLASVVVSALVAAIVPLPGAGPEILARTQPNLLDLAIAVTSGVVAAYAKIRPRINDAVAGTAIAVALMPPLCVLGISLARAQPGWAMGAFLLFLTNLLGIALASMIVFGVTGHATHRGRTRRAIVWTSVLTVVLLVPLGWGMWRLISQERLNAKIHEILLTKSVSFQEQLDLVSSRVNWRKNPVEVRVVVRAKAIPGPGQVSGLQALLGSELGQDFKLILEVSSLTEVAGD